MTLSACGQVYTRGMTHVVADVEDAGHSVRDPAPSKNDIESSPRNFPLIAKSVSDVDGRVLFLEENKSPNC